MTNLTMDKIVNLCKNRGFVFPGSEIYGGLANSWDFGPLGAELKIPMVDGTTETYKIPDATQTGTKFVIRNKEIRQETKKKD